MANEILRITDEDRWPIYKDTSAYRVIKKQLDKEDWPNRNLYRFLGAVPGAAAGAFLGSRDNKRKTVSTILGAVVGGLAGGVAGGIGRRRAHKKELNDKAEYGVLVGRAYDRGLLDRKLKNPEQPLDGPYRMALLRTYLRQKEDTPFLEKDNLPTPKSWHTVERREDPKTDHVYLHHSKKPT